MTMPTAVQSKQKSRKSSPPVSAQTAQAVYVGKRTKTGNSNGFRFEGALFKSHPEFSGEVRAHIIAPGRMLVTAEPLEEPADDPVLASFLAFLDQDMLKHPENIRPLDEGRSRRIKTLLKDVIVDENEDLGEENLLG
jgi:antitoxin PrlF